MKKRKYNILFIDIFSLIGGAQVSMLLLLKYIDRTKFNLICAIPESGPVSERIKALNVKVEIIPLKSINFPFLLGYLRTVWQLTQFVRRNKIDLVVCNVEPSNQIGLPAARLNRIPIVCHLRSLNYSVRYFSGALLHFPDVLIANSYATAECYSPYIRKRQNVVVVHNGVDLNEFSPRGRNLSIRKEYGIDENTFLIGVVARISRSQKSQDLFIRAMAEVVKVCPNVCALIVGDTKIDQSEDYLEELKLMVNQLGLKDNVIFTGFVSDMRELYAALDLLVMPSKVEPFGRPFIEAMAMEKPVVGTRAGGAVEIVDHGVTGILVPPNDVKAMSESIIKLVTDKKAAEEMGKAGRLRVERLFSVEENMKKTEEIYWRTVNASQSNT